MSHWQNCPDEATRTVSFRIYRTPVGKEIELVILSQSFVGAKLHYWRGRSTPCAGTNCQACMDGQRPRWKGYVQAMHKPTKTVVIFEFTDRVYDEFHRNLIGKGTLRGLTMTTRRLNKKPNGPINVEIGDIREESPHLPKEVNIQGMLDRMWEIRQKELPELAQMPDNTAA